MPSPIDVARTGDKKQPRGLDYLLSALAGGVGGFNVRKGREAEATAKVEAQETSDLQRLLETYAGKGNVPATRYVYGQRFPGREPLPEYKAVPREFAPRAEKNDFDKALGLYTKLKQAATYGMGEDPGDFQDWLERDYKPAKAVFGKLRPEGVEEKRAVLAKGVAKGEELPKEAFFTEDNYNAYKETQKKRLWLFPKEKSKAMKEIATRTTEAKEAGATDEQIRQSLREIYGAKDADILEMLGW